MIAEWLPVILIAHAGATLMMTGLDWFVHTVHYPMFAAAAEQGDEHWERFEREHLRRTAFVIPPLMLAELATALCLVLAPLPDGAVDVWLARAGLALLGVVWVATFAGAVPMHRRLERGFDERAHRLLMRADLVRLMAWNARSVIALLMLSGAH